MPTADQTIQEGIQAVKGGNFERARRLFSLVIEEDPDSEQGWYWLGLIAPDQDKRIACFLRALEINPSNQEARERLLRLGVPIPAEFDLSEDASSPPADDEDETGPLPPVQGKDERTRPRVFPEVFEPLEDEEQAHAEPALAEPAHAAPSHPTQQAGMDSTPPPASDDLYHLLEDEDSLEPGRIRQKSLVGRLLPFLAIMVVIACASLLYLSLQGGGRPFGLALAQSSATPSPSPLPTRPPATAILTPTPQPSPSVTPVTPSPTPTATLSPLDGLASLNRQAGEALGLQQSGQFESAVSAWDQVVATAPHSAEAHYWRGRSYLGQASLNGQTPENTNALLQRALDDLNQAIQIGPGRGAFYLTRYAINNRLAEMESFRSARAPLLEAMLQDVRAAAGFGLTSPLGDPNPGDVLLRLGRCQEAMSYLGEQVAADPAAIPPASLDTALARTYLCYGQLRGASLYANIAHSLEPTPEREWVQAIVLYNLGRYNETLNVLNDILEANPDSPGNRYYLRALVHFQRREFEQAQADLELGSQRTPEQAQLAAYVSALLARQAGDNAGATALFNLAEETLSPEYGLLLDQILAELGQPAPEHGIPVLPGSIVKYQDDPPQSVPPAALLSEPEAFLLPVRYDGSGQFHVSPGDSLGVHLYPPVPVEILFVDSLTLRLSSGEPANVASVRAALWDFGQGAWTPIPLAAGENPVSDPSRFVNPQGDIYLQLENQGSAPLAIDNLSLVLAIAGQQDSGQP